MDLKLNRINWIAAALCLGLTNVAAAQDRRTVTEPVVPPSCSTLMAEKFVADDRKMSDADEARPDTHLIQAALDRCAPGKAVELAAAPGKNAFMSGPIHIPEGVTLLIGKGVTLYASRKPGDYDYLLARGVCAHDRSE